MRSIFVRINDAFPGGLARSQQARAPNRGKLSQIEEEVHMLNLSQISLYGLALLAGAVAARAAASPAENNLLRLVPGGAQIVSGIADPGRSSATGRLLVVTKNNNIDLDDCLALLGVDGDQAINGVIEVASSSIGGDLSDHLLLISGHFNGARIFGAALENGSTRITDNGHTLLVIRPFDREILSMPDVRWMAILNNRVLVFGVPSMVAMALSRYERGEPADPILLERLTRLRPDVDSWSIIAIPPATWIEHLAVPTVPVSLETILKNTDEVELGVHYGRTARIDFSIHTWGSDSSRQLLSRAEPVLAALAREPRVHLQLGIDGQRRINGSVTVQEKVFDQWLAALVQNRLRMQESGNGER